MITAFYLSIAAAALIYLSARVIKMRRSEKISVGAQSSEKMERAMRVHANFVEYTPFAFLLLFFAESQGLPALAVHAFGILFLVARLFHFIGFRSKEAPGKFRVLGMVLTFGTIGTLAAVNIGLYASSLF